jgi:RNA polymerase sigma factor (sigma-70 family)
MTPKQLFLAHLPHIEKVVAYLWRKHHFRKEECEDFRSDIHLKMIKDDYAVFRKFQGRSSLKTYLTTVVSNEMRDYLRHLLGKWQPSAEAKRLGEVAIRLEKLLREGRSFDEAVRILQTNHKVEKSWQELYELAVRLPDWHPRPPIDGEKGLDDLPAPGDRADSPSIQKEREARRQQALAALMQARTVLAAEDRFILKMHGDGFTVARIARTLGYNEKQEKQLYRRIQRIFRELREELERRGFSKDDIDDIFDDD